MSIEPTCIYCGVSDKFRCRSRFEADECEWFKEKQPTIPDTDYQESDGLSPESSFKWNLFLDDERDPPNDGREWSVARSVDEALVLLGSFHCPTFISFDHDLGEDVPDGYDFAKALVYLDQKTKWYIPRDFTFYVHSQNPVGGTNIHAYLTQYLRVR